MQQDPFAALTNALVQFPQTVLGQMQAGVQNMVTTMGNVLQNVSSSMQRGQATMVGGIESTLSTFATQAAKPLVSLQEVREGGPLTEGGYSTEGFFQGQDEVGPSENLRETKRYARLTQNRRNEYDHRAGSTGFTKSTRIPREKSRGSPPKSPLF